MIFGSFVSKSQLFEPIKYSLTQKPKIYVNYDTRNSFVSNFHAKVKGVKLGLTYNNQLTLAIGYNWMPSKFNRQTPNGDSSLLKLRYVSPFLEYSFLEKNNFTVTIPIHLGFGWSLLEDKYKQQYNKGFVLLYEPAMTVSYRFLRYFSVGCGIGFRVLLVDNRKIEDNFNAPTYTVKATILVGTIYEDLKKAFKIE